MAQRKNTGDQIKYSHATEQENNVPISEGLTPEVQLIGGVYRETQPTYTDGQNTLLQTTASGDLKANMTAIAETSVPTAVADGASVNPNYNEYGQARSASYNYSTNTNDVTVNNFPGLSPIFADQTQLTTAATSTSTTNVSQFYSYGYIVTVASITTNVVLQLEGSADETNYAPLTLNETATTGMAIDSNKTTATITVDGTYALWTNTPVKDLQLAFVSESGGTAATISSTLMAKRQA